MISLFHQANKLVVIPCLVLLFLSLVLVLEPVSHGAPKIELNESSGAALGWPTQHEWKWLTVQPDVVALYSLVTIHLPGNGNILSVHGKTSIWQKPTKEGNQSETELQLLMPSLQDRIIVEQFGGQTYSLDIKISPSTPEVASRNCNTYRLQMIPQKINQTTQPSAGESAPVSEFFPIGVSCSKKPEGLMISVSVPDDVEWKDTSIFEVQGKGERWKQYIVPPALLVSGGDLGYLNLGYSGKNYSYLVKVQQNPLSKIPRTPLIDPASKRTFSFQIGVGGTSGSLNTPFTQGTFLEPTIFLSARTRKFLTLLNLGAQVEFGLPAPLSGQAMTYYEIQTYLGLNLELTRIIHLEPRFYFISMGGFYGSGEVNLQMNQIGLGMAAQIKLSSTLSLLASVVSSGNIPSSTSTVIIPELGVEFPFLTSKSSVMISSHSYKLGDTTNTSGNATYSQFIIYWNYQI